MRAWEALDERAAEPNPYVSPHFLRPAFEHLDAKAELRLVVVESDPDAPHWVAVAAFERGLATARFPVPHWRLYCSVYSMLSGVLLDRACAAAALEALLSFLDRGGLGGLAVRWDDLAGDGLACRTLRRLGRWHDNYAHARACLRAPDFGEAYLEGYLRPALRREIQRKERQLRAQGPSPWRLVRGAGVDERCIETFLALEDMGWRHEQGTSLRAVPSHAAFFRDMARACAARDRIVFAELLRGDEVICSSSNLLAGDALFAFKIGWNPAHARLSPGILNEVALVRELPRELPGLALLDGGAMPGSYLDAIYRGRREIVSGYTGVGLLGALLLPGLAWAKRIKRSVAGRAAPSGPDRVQAP